METYFFLSLSPSFFAWAEMLQILLKLSKCCWKRKKEDHKNTMKASTSFQKWQFTYEHCGYDSSWAWTIFPQDAENCEGRHPLAKTRNTQCVRVDLLENFFKTQGKLVKEESKRESIPQSQVKNFLGPLGLQVGSSLKFIQHKIGGLCQHKGIWIVGWSVRLQKSSIRKD